MQIPRPAERQSLPRGRLAGEAIKLQFHGLTPRKATRGATLGDATLFHLSLSAARDPPRTSRSQLIASPRARDALNPITNNKVGKGGSYAPLDERKNVVSDPILPLVVRVIYRASCASVRSRCLLRLIRPASNHSFRESVSILWPIAVFLQK